MKKDDLSPQEQFVIKKIKLGEEADLKQEFGEMRRI